MASEFDLIRRYFRDCATGRDDVVLGIGDDGALLTPPPGSRLVVSVDTLVAGVHFLPDCDPAALGYKALAVNLSDLAAMGAEPAWATLALTLPQADDGWLTGFSDGFCSLAREHGMALVGGDTTRGPLSVTVQVHGFVPDGVAFRRDAALAGDRIYVTGTLGDAGLALLLLQGSDGLCLPADIAYLKTRLERPRPRIAEALELRGRIHAAIDISDGLAVDLGHILTASGVGATLHVDRLPLSNQFRTCLDHLYHEARALPGQLMQGGDPALAWAALALGSGDDYELCFTAAPDTGMSEVCAAIGAVCIGEIEAAPGLRCVLGDGSQFVPPLPGYEHFGAT